MPRGMASRRRLGVILLCSAGLLVGGAAAPADGYVTEVIEGEHLLLRSTTIPSLFRALGPDDVIEWDVSISTTEPAESIDAELLIEGDIPVVAQVYACAEPWSRLPNRVDPAVACATPIKLHASHEGPSEAAGESFNVAAKPHLRIVLEMGSFDTAASGTVQLRVRAAGELLEAEPSQQEQGLLSPKDETAPVGSPEEDDDNPPDREARDRAYPDSSRAEQLQEPLPATGASVGLLMVIALALIAAGAHLRNTARR